MDSANISAFFSRVVIYMLTDAASQYNRVFTIANSDLEIDYILITMGNERSDADAGSV